MPNKANYEPYDPGDYLKTPEDIAEYINAAIEDGDERVMLAVLRDAAKAMRSMSDLSRETGLSRESLYKALSENGNPRFTNLVAVLHAFGLELTVRPMSPAH